MKTLIISFLLFVFAVPALAQISPDEFPKIGYADMYWLKRTSLYYYFNQNNPIDYSDSSWFFPQLLELGLTHVVSYGDQIPLNPDINSGIKIIDNNFDKWSTQPYNNPSKYYTAIGNATNHLSYEAGGNDIAILTNFDDNYGFGTAGPPITANAHSSWWIYPYNNQCDPDVNTSYYDPQPYNKTVHYLPVGQGPGKILVARLNYQHSGHKKERGWDNYLKLYIEARIDGANNSDPVAEVRIYEIPLATSENVENHRELYGEYYDDSPEPQTDFTYTIYANDFNGNNYTSIPSTQFLKAYGDTPTNSDIGVEITMLNTRNLYVDRIAVSNQWYYNLFLSDPNTQQQVRTSISNDINSLFSQINSNPLFNHLYRDEPLPMFYRGIGEVSNLAETELGSGKYINGASNALINDMMGWANIERRLPFVMYDYYPIGWNVSTSSTGENNLQTALDKLVNTHIGTVGYGVERYQGIRPAIQWAQNFTPSVPSDDIPFYHTIQVQAEKNVHNGQVVEPYRYRIPTQNEIFVQANLAMCYGAKGIVYFLINTGTPSPNNNGTYVSYYGLFEEYGNFGGITQDPANPQCRNERYWAVKKLNEDIY